MENELAEKDVKRLKDLIDCHTKLKGDIFSVERQLDLLKEVFIERYKLSNDDTFSMEGKIVRAKRQQEVLAAGQAADQLAAPQQPQGESL